VLAVNGDAKVKNVLVLMDVATGGGGVVDLFMDICPCEVCLDRMKMVVAQGMAEAEDDRGPARQRVH
jgi:hypothetical protein